MHGSHSRWAVGAVAWLRTNLEIGAMSKCGNMHGDVIALVQAIGMDKVQYQRVRPESTPPSVAL